jgi:MFS family permease
VNSFRTLIAIRDYRKLWLAQVASDFGDNLTFLTLLILVQRLTGSTVALAGLMISVTLPALVFGLLSGVYADRFDRKKAMIVSDVLRAMLVLGFVLVRSPELIPLMYVLAFLQASIATLFNPSRSALLPRIVGEENLLAANSISQTSRTIFNVLGTTAAGILAAVSDTLTIAFVVDSATFAISALLISQIRTNATPEKSENGRVWTEMKEGLTVLTSSRPLKAVLLGASIAMLGLGAVNVLIVPLLLDELQLSEVLFGLVEGGQVLGMIVAGTLVAALSQRLEARRLVVGGMVGLGIAIALVGQVNSAWQISLAGFLVGFMLAPVNGGVGTLAQTLVPDRLRGRVGGALNATISAATVLSMGAAGVAAAAIGVRNVFAFAGAFAIVGGIAAAFMFRENRTPTAGSDPGESQSISDQESIALDSL